MTTIARSTRIRRALVLATGQTTQYGGLADDGFYEKGELHRYTVLTTGQYSGTVNIALNGKTDAHSNACVMDDATGLMWSRTVSASVGPTSNGLLPYTTNGSGEGIYTYAAAANTAGLAGYSDWRVPNLFELITLCDYEASTAYPNATAFPTWSANAVYSSTTGPSLTTGAMFILFSSGAVSRQDKALTGMAVLVRGPL